MPCTAGARLRLVALVRTSNGLSFRNDHDAAIARIAALEQDLAVARDAAQEKSERDARRIAMLQRELDDLRRHEPLAPRRARSPSTRAAPSPSAPLPPIDELATRGPPVSFAQVALLLVVTGSIIAVAIVLLGRW